MQYIDRYKMTKKTIQTIYIDEDAKEHLEKQDNISNYVNNLILKDMGKVKTPIEEQERDIQQLEEILLKKRELIEQYYNNMLKEKEERTKEERETIDLKLRQKTIEEEAFINKWYPILSIQEEVTSFKGNPTIFNDLLPIVEALRKKDIKIGFQELKRFLLLK